MCKPGPYATNSIGALADEYFSRLRRWPAASRRGPPIASRREARVRLLLVDPDAGKILIEVVARGDLPPLDVRSVRDDPIPPQRDEVVRLLVEDPLLVGAHVPLLLGDDAGAVHRVVEL